MDSMANETAPHMMHMDTSTAHTYVRTFMNKLLLNKDIPNA